MASWEVRLSAPRRPWRSWLLMASLAVAVFCAGAWWQSGRTSHPDPQQGAQTPLSRQEQELERLRQRLAVVDSRESVAQQANEQSRLTIKALEEQIFQLQQDLAFYKGVLAPASRHEGLRIRAFELQSTDQPRLFRYKLMLSRVGKDDEPLEGTLQVMVAGQQDGRDVKLELASLTQGLPDQLGDPVIPFAFRHFQAIPAAGRFAELRLPEGFVPRQVLVRADIKGAKPLERTFGWID